MPKTKNLKIASVTELLGIAVVGKNERLVELIPSPYLKIGYQHHHGAQDMAKILNGRIHVRRTVAKMLDTASYRLFGKNPFWQLLVTYGFRSYEVQSNYFLGQLQLLVKEQSLAPAIEVFEEAHRRCAYPPVGGHVTGGAVDLTIWNKKTQREVPMGCKIADFGPLSYYTPSGLSPKLQRNRQILREVMEEAGFAPFDGEWWHFSYGDREWAYLYSKPAAIYSPVEDIEMQTSPAGATDEDDFHSSGSDWGRH